MDKKGQIGYLILVAAVVIGLVVASPFIGLWYRKYFGPKYADVERDIWENTRSRTNAAIQDINTRMVEYTRAKDKVEQNAICAYLRNTYPTFDQTKITDHAVRSFFEKCKHGG